MSTTARVLGAIDSAFLRIETPATPMHLGSLGIFAGGSVRDRQGRVRVAAVRASIERRLHSMPRMRQVVAGSWLPGGPPLWVDDVAFDIERHVRSTTLDPPGSTGQLQARCAQLLERPLDRRHPLWELWLIDGLSDGRLGALVKVHHAMADGLASVDLVLVLFDTEARPAPLPPPPAWHPRRPLPPRRALDDLGGLAAIAARWSATALGTALRPRRALHDGRQLLETASTLASLRVPRPACSLNVPISPKRAVDWLSLELEPFRRLQHAADATVNDILLTVVAGGLHTLLEGRGDPSAQGDLQVLVPVGFTHGGGELGNQVAALFVQIPVGPMSPGRRLAEIAARTRALKAHREELVSEVVLDLLAPTPQLVLAGWAWVVNHQPLVNLVVTNVPGPPVPLYLLGAELEEAVPFVPLARNLSLGVAALSYQGVLRIGLLADPERCPDLEVAARGMEQTARDLARCGGHGRAGAEPTER